jgi:hypothetical protein
VGNHNVPQFQSDVLIRTAECVDWRPYACLRHLSNDTRGASCGRHEVGERVEWAVSFAIGRRWLSVVDILAAGTVFGVAWKCGLGLGSSSGSGRGSGRGRRRSEWWRGSKGRRRFVLRCFTSLVALLVRVAGREIERGEGRRVRRFTGGAQSCVDARGPSCRVRCAGALAVAGVRRQKSDYGQAVCTGILGARQGAGVLCVLDGMLLVAGEPRRGRGANSRCQLIAYASSRQAGRSHWADNSREEIDMFARHGCFVVCACNLRLVK